MGSLALESPSVSRASGPVVGPRGDAVAAAGAGGGSLEHEVSRVAQARQPAPVLRRQAAAPKALLSPCGPSESATIERARGGALRAATNAVAGLRELLAQWGAMPTSTLAHAASLALASGFNIESDKSLWTAIGIDAEEVRSRDAKDKATTVRVLGNFSEIASDLPHYAAAPACQSRLTSGAPCFGCVADEHPRCAMPGVAAWVPAPFIGMPSSAIFFCSGYFTEVDEPERAGILLHEAAHLQPFGAHDVVGEVRYYGCPVRPVDEPGPGLIDPDVISGVADAYKCFVDTQRRMTSLLTPKPSPVPQSPGRP
jgi:hypothetical protein